MTLLYLVRHGETDWNRQRRIQGSSDIPLNDTGRRQAVHAGVLLARRSWDAIYSSPLSRAFETASIISDRLGLGEPRTLGALVERNYGEAEGMTGAQIGRRWPGATPVPGQESRDAVARRVTRALKRLAREQPGGHFILTTHGGVIRTMVIAAGADAHRHAPITNGSVHSFAITAGELRLVTFNDPIEHASALPGEDDITDQNAVEAQEAPRSKKKEQHR
ncbi:MAG: histidine phosphatase family protein [Cryobacterium sp.]|nr:histidine phosphatase family protein [Cryobacterium sp.]